MTPGDTIYFNYVPTIGQFDPTQTDAALGSVGLTPGTKPANNSVPQQNERINEIVANRGRIGGWRIENGELIGGNFVIDSDGFININNGDLYIDGDSQFIRLGQTTANHILLDGANRLITIGTVSTNYIVLDGVNNIVTIGDTGGSYITLDGANERIRSSNYSTGVSGFTLEPNLVEAQNIRARGVLQSAVFQKDVVSAVGGQLMVTNADILATDMTAADNSTLTIKGDTTFAANDILRIKDGTNDEWLRVTNAASAPTYTVTRDLGASYAANSNPAWTKGQAVVKQGESDGAATYSGGWLQLFGEGTNSPYYSVFSRTGVAYNSYAERVRLGNLNGIGSFAAETYGIFIGSTTDAGKRLTYDDVSGDLVVNGSKLNFNPFYGDGSDGDLTTSGNVTLTSDTYYNNLTVSNGHTLFTAGYRLFVKGTCTVTGTISRAGNAGTAGTSASGATGGTPAGSGGAALAAGNLSGTDAGLAGQVGPNGDSDGGANGTAGTAGTALTNLVVNSSNAGVAGGNGGNGLTGGGGTGGVGGAAGGVTGSTNKPRHIITAIQMFDANNTTSLKPIGHNGNSGSGAAGGGDATAGGNGGGGGASGGSGSNGGVMVLCARILAGNGTITCAGGNGGSGGAGGNGTAGAAGGGGGGGGGNGGNGGVMVLVYNQKTFSGTATVAGGIGGTGGALGSHGPTGGNDGTAGTNGTSTAGLKVELEV